MNYVRFRDPSGYTRRGKRKADVIETEGRTYASESVDILPPCTPSKIVCVGLNYAAHADETESKIPDRPKLFLKPPNTVRGTRVQIELPLGEKRFDPEAELAVVIDEQVRNIDKKNAMDAVRGFTCLNDLSNRTDQRQEQNWVRGKAFDGAAPLGPSLVPPEAVPQDATIECRVNGELRQSSSRDRMIFDVPSLIEEITSYLTLEPGDVIATGTPQGVEPLQDGDTIEITIEGIGVLKNSVKSIATE